MSNQQKNKWELMKIQQNELMKIQQKDKPGFVRKDTLLDKLPPHSPEAEQGVLGCCLLDPQSCIGETVLTVQQRPMFYDLRHEAIYAGMVRMWDASEPIDLITLQQRLKLDGVLEDIGGVAYLAALPDMVPSAANLSAYLTILEEKYLLRAMGRTCAAVGLRIQEWEGDVREFLDQVEADVLAVNRAASAGAMLDMKALVLKAIDQMEHMSRGVGMLGGLRTHLGYYDKMTGGLHGGEMIVFAGRPSVGKTSLAMNIAANVALREKKPVGVFSLEMSARDLTMRLMCAEAEANFHQIRTGFMSNAETTAIALAAKKIAAAPIHIDDAPAQTILQVRAKARRMASEHQVKLIVVDYLQLMKSPSADTRQEEIADISAGLKALAKELDIPVIALSQLNRESAKNKNRKPQLEDLRESGAIEQDADLVQMLYRPKGDGDEDDDAAQEFPVNGLIAKQRNGPTGDVQYIFKRFCMKYVDGYQNRGTTAPRKHDLPTSEEMQRG